MAFVPGQRPWSQLNSNWQGIFDLVGNLPNVAGSPLQMGVPNVQKGDLAFVVGGAPGLYLCMDPTAGAAVWSLIAGGAGGLTQLTQDVLAGPGVGAQIATVVGLQTYPIDPAAPATGDALVWDGTDWTPTPLPSSSLRRSYGSTTLAFPSMSVPYPLTSTGAQFASTNSGGNMDLIASFDSVYFRGVVTLRIYDLSSALIAETTQRFGAFSGVLAWINTTIGGPPLPSFDHVVTMEVFDVVDGTITPPAKVYGKNRAWAGLIGRASRGYWTPNVYSCRLGHAVTSAVPARTALLNDLWTAFYGVTMPGVWSADEFSCAWVSPQRRLRYECPRFHPAFTLPGGTTMGDRYQRDIVLGVTSAAPPSSVFMWDATAFQPIYYATLDAGGAFGDSFSITQSMSKIARLVLQGHTVVVAYPMVNNTDPNKKAIYLKPIGIDQVFFDNFDASSYQLEVVGWNARDKRPTVRVVPVSQFPEQRLTSPVSVGTMRDVLVPGPGNLQPRGRLVRGARFQLRSLLTNLVSPLSDAQIVRRVARARPWSLVVENSQTV